MRTVESILQTSQALLNDEFGVTFSTQSMLSFFRRAYRKLNLKLYEDNSNLFRATSLLITVPISADMHRLLSTDVDNYPERIQEPIRVVEKGVNDSNEDWTEMRKYDYLPFENVKSSLGSWEWSQTKLRLPGCSDSRHLMVNFIQSPPEISDAGDSINVEQGDLFLEAYTAGLVANFSGENPKKRGSTLNHG